MMAFAEGAVTRLRREFKLLLDADGAGEFRRRLGGDSCQTAITSVYFDRPGRPLTQRARAAPNDCLKIRTKEYFPDVGASSPRVVLEAKRERNGITQKQRLWLPRATLGRLMREEALWRRLPILDAGALEPVLAVTYVREVFQPSEAWRVTIDREVRFHAITAERAFGRRPLSASELPAPEGRERRVVVEVKHLGDELPEWLEALREHTQRFSKFGEGMRHMERAGVAGAQGG